jgi:hypothetical protein
MKFTVKQIFARTDIILSRDSKTLTPPYSIWSQGLVSSRPMRGSDYPAAFRIDRKKVAYLEVIIQIIDLMPGDYIFTLEGFGTENQGFILFVGEIEVKVRRKVKSKSIEFNVHAVFNPVHFYRLEGQLSWNLRVKEKKYNQMIVRGMQKTYLELFWLYGFDRELFKDGVPVELLRHAAYGLRVTGGWRDNLPINSPQTSRTIDWSTDPVIAAIVSVCFFRNPPRYDSFEGGHHLITIKPNFNHITFYLRRYIKYIHHPVGLCNCYDMAAAVQVHLKAVGINPVKFCFMNPFGYIRLSRLVGRGLCNSPFYFIKKDDSLDRDLIVDENYLNREPFGRHSFCCLPDDEWKGNGKTDLCIHNNRCEYLCRDCWVLDACVGPHTGNEDIGEYLYNAIDDITPTGGSRSDRKRLWIYKGVSSIDYITGIENEPQLPLTQAFKETFFKPEKELTAKNHNGKFVVYPWGSSGNKEDVRHTLEPEWKMDSEIIPGTNEVLKTWMFRYKHENIQINLYLFSHEDIYKATQGATYRFLELGSGSNRMTLPYKKGPKGLGNYSAQFDSDEFCRYLWTRDNVTFDVTGRSTSCNIEKLCKKWDKKAEENRTESIFKLLPSPSLEKIPENGVIIEKIGEEIKLETKCEKNVFIDFVYKKYGGIQLISREIDGRSLTFIGLKESINVITVAIVEQETLLVRNIDITIIITK